MSNRIIVKVENNDYTKTYDVRRSYGGGIYADLSKCVRLVQGGSNYTFNYYGTIAGTETFERSYIGSQNDKQRSFFSYFTNRQETAIRLDWVFVFTPSVPLYIHPTSTTSGKLFLLDDNYNRIYDDGMPISGTLLLKQDLNYFIPFGTVDFYPTLA